MNRTILRALSGLVVLAHALSVLSADPPSWGPYRPNLYFGLRPRHPLTLLTGLIWHGTHDYQSVSKSRHACSQDDGLASYTWTWLEPEAGGSQTILDPLNNVRLTTEFVVLNDDEHGERWGARIRGEPIDENLAMRLGAVWYAGVEGLGHIEMEKDEEKEDGFDWDEEIFLNGNSPELGDWRIKIVQEESNEDAHPVFNAPLTDELKRTLGKTTFIGAVVPPGNIWQAKEVIMQRLLKNAQAGLTPYGQEGPYPDPRATLNLPNEAYASSNLFAIHKTFSGSFSFDVYYNGMDKATLSATLSRLEEAYSAKFRDIFPIAESTPALEAFSQAITANLIGGVGYFHGTSIIDRTFSYEWDDEDEDDHEQENGGPELTPPMTLLTATPSRSFFPRGFYWDEGFHLLHIGQWDDAFALQILRSWVDLIDENGWVAREQILGEEARSKVPSEFQVQVPKYANPPTLVMAVASYIDRVKAREGLSMEDLGMQIPLDTTFASSSSPALDPSVALPTLRALYAPLKRHYDWFRRTQRGLIKPFGRRATSRTEAYRWRGRNERHVLTSGMDDYPRPTPPHQGELHLDLISWMAYFTRTMGHIARYVGEHDDAESFDLIYSAIVSNIDDLHWSEEDGMYCDASVDDEDENMFVCHKGYLSLFPLLLELLPSDSPNVPKILDLMRDENELWSNYGLRSLSKSHPEFGKDENYWKGPVWVQMNFLALRALYNTYAKQTGQYQAQAQKVYVELRRNIIDNVFNEYNRTGYVWEQYDALTGKGLRSHPFTGWTSLVTLILSEKY